MANMTNIRIDADALKEALTKNKMGWNMSQISTQILGCDASYLSTSFRQGTIKEASLDKLCALFNLNKADFIKEERKTSTEAYQTSDDLHENIITGITSICNTLKYILAEQRDIKLRLAKLETMEGTLKTICGDTHKTMEKTTALYTDVNFYIKGR